uniref:Uncharacterized protein n=1 Tax=Megaselia scalaris TaxID=36166 RepID=T1GIC5_MEGSC
MKSNKIIDIGSPSHSAIYTIRQTTQKGIPFIHECRNQDIKNKRSKTKHQNPENRKKFKGYRKEKNSRVPKLMFSLACAPRYVFHQMQPKRVERIEPVGTCFTSTNFTSFTEFAPCRSHDSVPIQKYQLLFTLGTLVSSFFVYRRRYPVLENCC